MPTKGKGFKLAGGKKTKGGAIPIGAIISGINQATKAVQAIDKAVKADKKRKAEEKRKAVAKELPGMRRLLAGPNGAALQRMADPRKMIAHMNAQASGSGMKVALRRR
jgi:hypothetical protein